MVPLWPCEGEALAQACHLPPGLYQLVTVTITRVATYGHPGDFSSRVTRGDTPTPSAELSMEEKILASYRLCADILQALGHVEDPQPQPSDTEIITTALVLLWQLCWSGGSAPCLSDLAQRTLAAP
jgi:hypothetical protein